jgi:hypothetical protein
VYCCVQPLLLQLQYNTTGTRRYRCQAVAEATSWHYSLLLLLLLGLFVVCKEPCRPTSVWQFKCSLQAKHPGKARQHCRGLYGQAAAAAQHVCGHAQVPLCACELPPACGCCCCL